MLTLNQHSSHFYIKLDPSVHFWLDQEGHLAAMQGAFGGLNEYKPVFMSCIRTHAEVKCWYCRYSVLLAVDLKLPGES